MSGSGRQPSERKHKEAKESLSQTQWELLAQFLAPVGHELYPDGGILIESVLECKKPDLGTRLLYLERAMTQTIDEFNASLDKLYTPTSNLTAEEKKNEPQIELITSLKKINDFCANGRMKYFVEVPNLQVRGRETRDPTLWDFEERSVIQHTFKNLGDAINEVLILAEAKKFVEASIDSFIEKNKEKKQEIDQQKEARLVAEEKITPQQEWRTILDLPESQLPPTSVLFGNHGPGFVILGVLRSDEFAPRELPRVGFNLGGHRREGEPGLGIYFDFFGGHQPRNRPHPRDFFRSYLDRLSRRYPVEGENKPQAPSAASVEEKKPQMPSAQLVQSSAGQTPITIENNAGLINLLEFKEIGVDQANFRLNSLVQNNHLTQSESLQLTTNEILNLIKGYRYIIGGYLPINEVRQYNSNDRLLLVMEPSTQQLAEASNLIETARRNRRGPTLIM